MIKYSLQCSNGHSFDGWFRDSATYDEQAGDGTLCCPSCEDPHISRSIMSPHIANNAGKNRGGPQPTIPLPTPSSAPVKAVTSSPPVPPEPVTFTPQQVEAMEQVGEVMKKMKEHVLNTCKDVGNNLAEEARKIHYGEKKAEGIYGIASKDDIEELQDEGIDVLPVPFLQKSDA